MFDLRCSEFELLCSESAGEPLQHNPEQLVCRSESPARALGVKNEQLLTKRKIVEDEIVPRQNLLRLELVSNQHHSRTAVGLSWTRM